MKNILVSILISIGIIGCGSSNDKTDELERIPIENGGGEENDFEQRPDVNYRLVNPNELEAKECYFLSLMRNLPEMKSLVKKDPFLRGIAAGKYESFSSASTMDKQLSALRFSQEEIVDIGKYLVSAWEKGNSWDQLAEEHLSLSGTYIGYRVESAAELLCSAWKQDAAAVNRIIDIYAIGTVNAHCDDDTKTATNSQLATCINEIKSSVSSSEGLFFELSLTAACKILAANEREKEPVLFEPLEKGCNKLCYEKMKSVDWKKYNYAVIMVPGNGPSDLNTPLDPGGQKRCDYGYNLWLTGKAPFILVSGGRIHPMKTKYCEAEEMKKYLIQKGVPEECIIMEPHARHTPTNFRNVSRILWRHIPVKKASLVACEKWTIENTFKSQDFANRCMSELGYMPVTFGDIYTETSLEFYPNVESLQISAKDPLDP